MNPSGPFTATININLAAKLLEDLKQQEFEISNPAHTFFSAKKKGVTCTFYLSGKLVVQGKEMAQFIEFYLEPQILGTFHFTNPLVDKNMISHIGIDESGKGDFFGPLCIAGVFVRADQFAELHAIGVKDSKTLTDKVICKIADKIKKNCLYQIVKINPPKYNQIYAEFKNLNSLLAWGHATTIEQLVEKSGCQDVIVDQFANEYVVENALKRKKLKINLTQRHRGEEDLAVAAASILARQTFVEGLDQLGQELGITLPKGASAATKQVAVEILRKYGLETLKNVCKQHFKTLDAILGKR
jgi:ribonuclease HIII